MSSFWEKARELEAFGPFVVITLARARGHVPQEEGAKAIVTVSGLEWGTVGGGKVEARAIAHAQEMLASGQRPARELITWNLQRDVGMTCGGETTYFFERHGDHPWRIAIFGAGHVAQALVRVLLPLDCKITCVDSRVEWLGRLPDSPKLEKMLSCDPPAEVARMSSSCSFAIMTQGHATDLPVLELVLKTYPDAPFVGVMGSDVKAMKLRAELSALGIAPSVIEKIHCPIGYKTGGNTPEEIAITVACQLLPFKPRCAIEGS